MPTQLLFEAKEHNGDLDYYGSRYYDGRMMQDSSMSWISAYWKGCRQIPHPNGTFGITIVAGA